MAMTSHIRLAVRNLLDSWEKDAASSYKNSFIMSAGCLKHAQDEKEKVFSCPDSTAEKERAEVLYPSQSSYLSGRLCFDHADSCQSIIVLAVYFPELMSCPRK